MLSKFRGHCATGDRCNNARQGSIAMTIRLWNLGVIAAMSLLVQTASAEGGD